MVQFQEFPKIPRLSRDCTITEKIDGTNAVIYIGEDGELIPGSRSRWLALGKSQDNYGFAAWCAANVEELRKLGPGYHYGEWWGMGINRGYGMKERKLSLFNTKAWSDPAIRPSCCDIVPVLFEGPFDYDNISNILDCLSYTGSVAAPGFKSPEGICIFHHAAKQYFKKTILKDEEHKSTTKKPAKKVEAWENIDVSGAGPFVASEANETDNGIVDPNEMGGGL